MKDRVIFRFGKNLLLSKRLSCKNCAFANSFNDKCDGCPVLHYSYTVGLTITDNNAWLASARAENISIIIDDVADAFRAYRKSKQLAAECIHNTARNKSK